MSPRTQFSAQTSSKTLDPCALLSLPEFIREGVPEEIVQEMEIRRDAETLMTLPEFIKQYPQPEFMRSASSTDMDGRPDLSEPDFSTSPLAVRPAKNRSRSMSEPLSWLLSGSNSRSSSPIGGSSSTSRKSKSKLSRPRSSNGSVPTVHGTSLKPIDLTEGLTRLHRGIGCVLRG